MTLMTTKWVVDTTNLIDDAWYVSGVLFLDKKMKNSLNLTKVVYRDAVKIIWDKNGDDFVYATQ